MDSFGILPPPLLLNVMKCIPDLLALRSLQCASPIINRILQEDGIAAEVIEAVLSSGSTLVSNQFLIRTAVLISWGPNPGNIQLDSLEGFRAALYGVVPSSSLKFGLDPELPGSRPLTSWKGLPVATLLRVAALSGQVQKLVHYCFHTLLNRVLASHPRRPIDPMYDARQYWRICEAARKSRLTLRPPVPIPPSEPIVFMPAATAPPSWGEQQLLEHGAWSFALYSLLRNSTDGIASESWPFATEQLSFKEFWKERPHVFYGLVAVEQSIVIDATRISTVLREGNSWNNNLTCCTGVNLLEGDDTRNDPYGEQDRLRRLIIRDSSSYSNKHTNWTSWSPIYRAKHDCWDWLGFTLWSSKRMAALGFMVHADNEMRRNRMPGGDWPLRFAELHDLFAWRSVMTNDQVSHMENRRQAEWAESIGEHRIHNLAPAESETATTRLK